MSHLRPLLRAARGSSVVELLVAAALTGVLLTGVIAIFLSWRSSSQITDRLASTQEAGQRAIETLATAIRSAGYAGCARSPLYIEPSLASTLDPRWNVAAPALRGYHRGMQHEMLPYAPNADPDSELLFVRSARSSAEGVRLAGTIQDSPDEIGLVAPPDALRSGDVALINSCRARAYFTVAGVAGSVVGHRLPADAVNTLGYALDADAEVLPMEVTLFYLGRTRTDAELSLWRRVDESAPQEIARGVSHLQFRYGTDDDDDGVVDDYRAAADVADWSAILSVSIELQVDQPEADAAGSDGDSQTFRTTVALRNSAQGN